MGIESPVLDLRTHGVSCLKPDEWPPNVTSSGSISYPVPLIRNSYFHARRRSKDSCRSCVPYEKKSWKRIKVLVSPLARRASCLENQAMGFL